MIDQLQLLLEKLKDAEYLHVLLETFPVYGIFGGLLILAFAIALKDLKFQTVALAVILVSSLASYPQIRNRKLAEPHMLQVRNAEYKSLIKTQTQRRSSMQWAYVTLAIGCVLTIMSRKAKIGPLILWLTLGGGGAVALLSTWLHMKDAEISHPNIRLSPSTEAEVVPPGLPGIQPSSGPDSGKQ